MMLLKMIWCCAENDLVLRNVMQSKSPPKVPDEEMVIVREVPIFIAEIKASGRNLYVQAMASLFTDMRRNKVLALKWGHGDLDRNIVGVHEALEFTKAHGVRFKSPRVRPDAATSPCPIFWSMCCATIARHSLNFAYGLVLAKCMTPICCSQTLTGPRFPQMRLARRGVITPRRSAGQR
jgi:hypothetical protein